MKLSLAGRLLLLASMLLAVGLAWAFTPTAFMADKLPALQLNNALPSAFGDWQEVPAGSAQIVDPSSQTLIDALYTETLSRTYVNRENYRIMLSIAYGRDQRDSLQLHQPEVCYPAQGFKVVAKDQVLLQLPTRKILGTHLQTQLGNRHEPVTYWTMVGQDVFQGQLRKKLAELQYARQGLIPDGMLVRVSSIDLDANRAFQLQQQFAADMIAALRSDVASRFAGPASP